MSEIEIKKGSIRGSAALVQRIVSPAKLSLLCRVNDFAREIISAALIPDDDGFITISSDRSIRVWLKRESGRFWPSVCQYLSVLPCSIKYEESDRSLFIGLSDGMIMGYALADDLNSITQTITYAGHTGCVTGIHYSNIHHWLLSTGTDKFLCWHSTLNGTQYSTLAFDCQTTCVTLDDLSGCVFVGEQNGNIQFLELSSANNSDAAKATKLVGHATSVKSLYWQAKTEQLYSASVDVIIIWDIGGKRGCRYELYGQPDNVDVACGVFVINGKNESITRRLINAYTNGMIAFWDIRDDSKRIQTAEWSNSNKCELCGKPFIWCLKDMWQRKLMGVRQHHCRRCGKALCESCSPFRSVLPQYGFETPVRLCRSCNESLTPQSKLSMVNFCDSNHPVKMIFFDEKSQRILSVAADRSLKVWRIEYGEDEEHGSLESAA